MKKGDIITFTNNDLGFERTIRIKITSIHNYSGFEKYLEKETLEKCLLGIDTIKEGLNVYYKYYTKENEEEYNIVAIRFKIIKN